MGFTNFKDYLTERTKHSHGVVSDNKGFANRDYDGDLSLKPKQGKYIKPDEYYAPGAKKNPGLVVADNDRSKALGDMATPGLTPKNSGVGEKSKKKKPSKKAMKVEHFLDKTKNMSDIQFTKHLLKENKISSSSKPVILRDLYGKKFTPEPAQTMKYVVQLMLTNENIMRRMVRELKRNSGFGKLIAEVLNHPETYEFLNEAARGKFGETPERKIALFFEGVSPPRAGTTNPGPASAGSPGGQGDMQQQPASGISGGPDSGGGYSVHNNGAAATGAGGAQGMGEDEMEMGNELDDNAPQGDIDIEKDHHKDDDDDDEEGMDSHDDDDEDHDENDDDDEDEEGDDDDEEEDGEEEDDGEDHKGMSQPNIGMVSKNPNHLNM